jgi:hypothetical protein
MGVLTYVGVDDRLIMLSLSQRDAPWRPCQSLATPGLQSRLTWDPRPWNAPTKYKNVSLCFTVSDNVLTA